MRDWSSAANGATVERYTGPDNSASGCGPGGLIDDRLDSVWGSERSASGQTIVIDLGAPVDVAGVAIDPAAGCGDDASAGLGDYEVSGATGPDGDYRALGLPGAFPTGEGGALRDLAGAAAPRVRYVRLHAKTPQDTSAGGSGADFLDVAELHVAKTPGSALGPSADTGAAQGVGATMAGLTGTVTPRGGAAQVLFEYGPTSAYGSSVAAQTLGAGDAAGRGRRRGGRPAAAEPLPLPRRRSARRRALRGRRRDVRHRRGAAALAAAAPGGEGRHAARLQAHGQPQAAASRSGSRSAPRRRSGGRA